MARPRPDLEADVPCWAVAGLRSAWSWSTLAPGHHWSLVTTRTLKWKVVFTPPPPRTRHTARQRGAILGTLRDMRRDLVTVS